VNASDQPCASSWLGSPLSVSAHFYERHGEADYAKETSATLLLRWRSLSAAHAAPLELKVAGLVKRTLREWTAFSGRLHAGADIC
jgi:hypothetical protein